MTEAEVFTTMTIRSPRSSTPKNAAAEAADLIPSSAPVNPAWASRALVSVVRNSAFSSGLNSLRGRAGMGGNPSGSKAAVESRSIWRGLPAIC